MAVCLPDDLLGEILLRLAPHPPWLLRASLVCKRWRGVVTAPGFLHRLRATVLGVFISNPPLYGTAFFPAGDDPPMPNCAVPGRGDPPNGVLASRFHPPGRWWIIRDCRRGRALLCDAAGLVVWDPVSHDVDAVPRPPGTFRSLGAVLLGDDVAGSRGFLVAAAAVEAGSASAAVYSSVTGAWGHHVTAPAPASCSRIPYMEKPGAAVGDTVYWLLDDDRLLSLELPAGGKPSLAILEPRNVPSVYAQNVQIMRTPDGKLGLAAVTGSALCLWTLECDGHGATSWAPRRTIALDALLPGTTKRCPDETHRGELAPCAQIVGVHEDGAMVFLRRPHVFYMLRLEPTPEIKEIAEIFIMEQQFATVYSYDFRYGHFQLGAAPGGD